MSKGISDTPSNVPGHSAYIPQESEEGACQGAGGDQTDTKCALGDRTVYGSHRPEVRFPALSKLINADIGVVRV